MRALLIGSEGAAGVNAAAEALRNERPALDVVELGIRPVETDPSVKSVGVGGRPNILGDVELDASIMDGRTLLTGSIGALRGYTHPISIARRVMEHLPHVFLVGEGAAQFAAECGAERGATLTAQARSDWQDWLAAHVPVQVRRDWPPASLVEWVKQTVTPETAHGTTILLTRDLSGQIAGGVSTSGWGYKYPGRLGDSPVIGAGLYADTRYGAAACTGQGELSIRAGTARSIVLYMKLGYGVAEACQEAANDLRALYRRYQATITLYAIDRDGQPAVVTLGGEEPMRYFYWSDGMPAPDERVAPLLQW